MKDKNNKAMIALIVLLIVAIGYIAMDKYTEKKQQEEISIYQQGVQAGYDQAVIQLVQQASTCQPVPVTVNNQTLNLYAMECVKE